MRLILAPEEHFRPIADNGLAVTVLRMVRLLNRRRRALLRKHVAEHGLTHGLVVLVLVLVFFENGPKAALATGLAFSVVGANSWLALKTLDAWQSWRLAGLGMPAALAGMLNGALVALGWGGLATYMAIFTAMLFVVPLFYALSETFSKWRAARSKA